MSNETTNPLDSFDARDWAKEFLRSCEQSPIVGAVAPDEETMVAWFANALMRGYDEHRWKMEKLKIDSFEDEHAWSRRLARISPDDPLFPHFHAAWFLACLPG